ncbi:WD40-repeat-containing domain protein [Suillus plorans]|uniref:WD40-repeat-containing domain protein n=1 Tax=Suillus plorans TaxID=116603 RepID=A0A9P7AN46_9AGAM|nr:WD40-repeat-containing domain protein [Suillus plorans]KAG1791870.1 WD40-repeat-containing domain protein [Suillus plorans]
MAARSCAVQTPKETSTASQSKRLTFKYKFEGHERKIWDFVFLHDNVHIVSGSSDGTMCKWNCDTGLVVGKPWKAEGEDIYALALSPDGKVIACGRKDGSVQQWTTDGKRIEGVWTGHSKVVQSLSWSPSGRHIASGSGDGTILIRRADSGKVEVGPINMKQNHCMRSLAYSPSGERIASGGSDCTICIWDTKTGELIIGPINGLGLDVTSLVWSADSSKLYSASDTFARVFNSTSGELLHSFEHDDSLYSVALSPKNDVLVCVGFQGVAQLWDTESHQPLGQPFYQEYNGWLLCVSFSRDGRYVAYGGDDGEFTLWMLKDVAAQLPAPTPPQQGDGQSTQQKTRPSSPSLSCLDVDATRGGGFIEEAHDDPYNNNNFFQFSQQSLPLPSPGFHLPSLFSARRLLNVISRRHSPPDESVLQERSKRGFFGRRARSNLSVELATIKPNQSVPEGKVREEDGEGEGEQGGTVDDRASANDSLGARKDKGKQRSTAHLDSEDNRNLWKRLFQPQGKNPTSGCLHSTTPPACAPQQILHNPWHWNSSLFFPGSSRCPVDIAACRDEDRYGIVPETDAEAAAAMLRTNDDVASSSTQPGQLTVVAYLSQGQPIQTQASRSGPEEILYGGADSVQAEI